MGNGRGEMAQGTEVEKKGNKEMGRGKEDHRA